VRSCHRIHVDAFLAGALPRMRGRVLDIGGSRVNKKGEFRPPQAGVTAWEYLNIDKAAEPDYLCDAEHVPLPDGSVDCFLMCEVLEHVERPEVIIKEAARVLRSGGSGVMTMPFLYPVHADPYDFQRWTADKFRREIEAVGLRVVSIEPLGGPISALHDTLLNLSWRQTPPGLSMRVLAKLLTWTVGAAVAMDRRYAVSARHITSGWGAVVEKPDVSQARPVGAKPAGEAA
jgi:SAM-dependent methyltransferase